MMISVQFFLTVFTSLGSKTLLNMMVIRRRHDGGRCSFLNHVTQLTDADVSNKYQHNFAN